MPKPLGNAALELSWIIKGKRLINHTFQIIFPSVNLPTVLITGDTDEFIKPKKMVKHY